jgi:hypothetical protein
MLRCADYAISLADAGLAPLALGETLSLPRQNGLKFRPTLNSLGASSRLVFTANSARNTAAPTGTLMIKSEQHASGDRWRS